MTNRKTSIQKATTITAILFLLTLILVGGAWILNKFEIIILSQPINKIAEKLFFLISVIIVANIIKRGSIRRFLNLFDEPEEQIFYSKLWNLTIYGLALFVILFYFGVSLGNITLIIGIMATGFAFAIREILLSFFGWLILLRKKPFRIGDYIKIGDDEGKVIHIGTFYVLLDKTSELPEDFTRVPNWMFLQKSIVKLGTENIFEQLNFPIISPLNESPSVLKDIEKELANRLNNEYTSVYYDIKNDKLILIVEYLVSFAKRKDTRTEVICIITQKMADKNRFAN